MPEPRHGVTVDPAAIGKPDWVCGRCLNNAETCPACSSTGCRPGSPQYLAAIRARETVGCPRCGRRCSPWNLFRDRNREDVCLDCAHRADREADR
jgi:hypothetical protein